MVQLSYARLQGYISAFAMFGCLLAVQCGGDDATENPPPPDAGNADNGNPELTGQSCTTADQCYPGLDGAALQGGAAVCLSHILGGYCTHLCTKDEDCCAIPGECRTSLKQVCAPFESTGQKLCFLSCDDRDIRAADAGSDVTIPTDPDVFCSTEVAADFACRSTGGGVENRRACTPGVIGPDATTDGPPITVDTSTADAMGPAPDATDGSAASSDASDAAAQ